MKKEYLIIGSNNFWYGSCLSSLKEVKAEIENIRENVQSYGNPEATGDSEEKLPDSLYIYKAEQIDKIEL